MIFFLTNLEGSCSVLLIPRGIASDSVGKLQSAVAGRPGNSILP